MAEIEFYIKVSKSRFALTLDAFYGKFKSAMEKTPLEALILTKLPDYLPRLKGIGFKLTTGRKIPPVPADSRVRWFADLMKGKFPDVPASDIKTDDLAVILYSGGTTGKPKGIMLSNYNFISHGLMVANWAGLNDTDSILAILPLFHCFGLGVCVNGTFMGGGKSILVPTFTPDDVAKLIKRNRPTFIIGVPTIYEALNKSPLFNKSDLSCLRAAFSGADSFPKTVKERFEEIVQRQGGSAKLLEGYGLTEAVTGIIATPLNKYREDSIGVPYPDMMAKIVKLDTMEEAPVGDEGELCVQGPAVMLGYLDQPEETAAVLKKHQDGLTWLHTSDICSMDADYKRMNNWDSVLNYNGMMLLVRAIIAAGTVTDVKAIRSAFPKALPMLGDKYPCELMGISSKGGCYIAAATQTVKNGKFSRAEAYDWWSKTQAEHNKVKRITKFTVPIQWVRIDD